MVDKPGAISFLRRIDNLKIRIFIHNISLIDDDEAYNMVVESKHI